MPPVWGIEKSLNRAFELRGAFFKMSLNHIFEQIAAEYKRQDEKVLKKLSMVGKPSDLSLSLANMMFYRKLNEAGKSSWMSLLLELAYEAIAEENIYDQRELFIGMLSVGIAIVEYLDRQIEGGPE